MRIVSILLVLLVLGSCGYAYYKDPTGCQKLATDVATDTMAIIGTFKPPYFTPSPETAPPPKPAVAAAPNGVEYPMGYVATHPAIDPQSPAPAPQALAAPAPAAAPLAAPAGTSLGSYTDYDQALAAARQAHAPMLVLFTGSDWCHYCQMLEQEVLSTKDFTNYVSSHYVFLTIDDLRNTPVPDNRAAEIKQLEQKFSITGFPTLMIVSDDEKEKGRSEGYDPGSGSKAVIGQLDQIAAK